jgi:hypothetical protein
LGEDESAQVNIDGFAKPCVLDCQFFENRSFPCFQVRIDRWPQRRWSWACALRG